MAANLLANRYGKSRVRLVHLSRQGSQHDLREITVQVLCEGDFETSYTAGDNTKVLATDTMKNTVYALAKREGLTAIEIFAHILAAHFLTNHAQVTRVRIKIAEDLWDRIHVGGQPHGSSFVKRGGELRTTRVSATREAEKIQSGISGLTILKSADSAFEGFPRDPFTTLPETKDRILATSLRARWRYRNGDIPFDEKWHAVRRTMLEAFAQHHSRSVQHTLYAMAEQVLNRHPDVEKIHITMPNQHCLLVDLARFGMSNENEIFVPTDEPHGYIEARLGRADSVGQAPCSKERP
ncbi:MAG: factor-independent urate hydroxylase [Bryobacteraceae bacterium]